jgi:tRNA A-37 threonylcarbamoyl transferase component Bud32
MDGGALTPPPMPVTGLTGRLPANAFLRNRYLIVRKIGQGGMAAVYQATELSQPGTAWAIKEMSDAALINDQERVYAIQAFQQEGDLLRRLNHPNLPKVIDFFTEGGKHYLVMEYVPGQTLHTVLEKRSQPFTEAEVLSWAEQLCDVLGYLHKQQPKIIFRDLKPSNIMLTPNGQIKLIDFGIVRFFKPGKTRDTVAMGTPGYVAQEAVGGQTDERSDIYSLCVTLHQLLTLNDPCMSMFNIAPARQLNPAVSPEMERILMRGLQNNRGLRWQTVDEMRAALIYLRGGTPGETSFASPFRMTSSPEMVVPGLGRTIAAPSAAPDYPGGAVRTMAAPRTGPGGAPGTDGTAFRPQMPTGGGTPVSPTVMAPRSTSRPTTRLLIVAKQLSGWQLAALVGGAVVALIIGTILLTPVLEELPFQWNNVPIFAIFGALGYAAYPKRGAAFASHVLFSTILVTTVWMQLGSQGYSWSSLALGVLLSGAFMEIWVAFLPKIRGERGKEAWMRELLWLAVMAVIGSVLFLGVITNWISGRNPVQWLASAILGGVGWFLGDLLQQYLMQRQTGLPMMR